MAEGAGEQPLPVQPAARSGQGGVLGTRKVYIRAGADIEKPGIRRDLDEECSEESQHGVQRERIMTHSARAKGGSQETTCESRG